MPVKSKFWSGMMLKGAASPTTYKYGTRRLAPAPVIVTKPSYEPGMGRLPSRRTVMEVASPGFNDTLDGVTVTRALRSESRGATARLKVAREAPVLPTARVRLTGNAACAMAPKDSVAGST